MSLHNVSLGDLPNYDGGQLLELFDREIEAAIRDCYDRPGISTKRLVTLEITITPQRADSGECDDVRTQPRVKSKKPVYTGSEVICAVRRQNGRFTAVYNDMSPDNPDQLTFE